jgi:hypothetical protein
MVDHSGRRSVRGGLGDRSPRSPPTTTILISNTGPARECKVVQPTLVNAATAPGQVANGGRSIPHSSVSAYIQIQQEVDADTERTW